jgi:hypothetical protein
MFASPDYIKQQEKLHAKGNYGVTAGKYGELISRIIDKLEIDTVTDYGCGSNLSLRDTLKPARDIQYQAYDPCVARYAELPIATEMVICCDVLEHIEPEFLEDVLDHLMDLTEVCLFCSINTGPAGKILDDGRNAHLIQQPMEWWLPKLWERFSVQKFQISGPNEFYIFAYNLGLKISEQGKRSIIQSPILRE